MLPSSTQKARMTEHDHGAHTEPATGADHRKNPDLPMAVGAIAMSASTIIVAANAQFLRRLKLRPDEVAAPRAAGVHV
jgi:hypothetical protein